MKGIYKKLSVGVLAAALLVGGSGLAKGGQAFADSFRYIKSDDQIEKYLKESEEKDAPKKYDAFKSYIMWSNRRQALKAAKEQGFQFREVQELSEIDKVYPEGWDLRFDKENVAKQINSKPEYRVRVGDLYFIIKK